MNMCESIAQFLATQAALTMEQRRAQPYIDCDPPGEDEPGESKNGEEVTSMLPTFPLQ